jgi:hypothetical protein
MLHNQNNVSIIKNPWESGVKQICIKITDDLLNLAFNGIEAKSPSLVTYVKVDGKKIALHDLDFNQTLQTKPNTHNEIIFKDYHSEKKRVFKLPDEMNRNLLHFLTGSRRHGDNCMDFVNIMLFGCRNDGPHRIYLNLGKAAIIGNDNNLAIGQAIAIGSGLATHEMKHFAIYLGNGLYISMMGDNNPLYVTTLEQMKLIYSVNTAVKVTPISPSNDDFKHYSFAK